MANASKITANNKTFSIKDATARESVAELETSKQNTLSVSSPLSLDSDGNLTINLGSYYKKTELDENLADVKQELNELISGNTQKIELLYSRIIELLASCVDSELAVTKTLPDISNYTETVEDFENRITSNTNSISSINETLTNTISENKENIETSLSEVNENLTKEITENSDRLTLLEKEMWGDDASNYGSTSSRLDDIETKFNKVYKVLVATGFITEDE